MEEVLIRQQVDVELYKVVHKRKMRKNNNGLTGLLAGITIAGAFALYNPLCSQQNSAGYSFSAASQQSNRESKDKKAIAQNSRYIRDYQTADFSKDSDKVILARMLFGEARSCSDSEKVAIAYTAINRANDGKKWNGETVREVILKPYQYSCFNYNDRNRSKLFDPEKYDAKSFQKCLAIAEAVLTKKYADPTNGATHYHTLNIKPRWAKSSKMKKIGRIKDSAHIFYREL